MAGTKEGGIKASRTIKKIYGADHYKKLGQKGGKLGTTGGFASDKIGADGLTGLQRASLAGKRGGTSYRKIKYNIVVNGVITPLVDYARDNNINYGTAVWRYKRGKYDLE